MEPSIHGLDLKTKNIHKKQKGKTQHFTFINLNVQSRSKHYNLSCFTSQPQKKMWKPRNLSQSDTKEINSSGILQQRKIIDTLNQPFQKTSNQVYQTNQRKQSAAKSKFFDSIQKEKSLYNKNKSQHKNTPLRFDIPAFRDTLTYFERFHIQKERQTHNPYRKHQKKFQFIELPAQCQQKYQVDKQNQIFLRMHPEFKLKSDNKELFNQLERKKNFKKLEKQSIKREDKITANIYIRHKQST